MEAPQSDCRAKGPNLVSHLHRFLVVLNAGPGAFFFANLFANFSWGLQPCAACDIPFIDAADIVGPMLPCCFSCAELEKLPILAQS